MDLEMTIEDVEAHRVRQMAVETEAAATVGSVSAGGRYRAIQATWLGAAGLTKIRMDDISKCEQSLVMVDQRPMLTVVWCLEIICWHT